jgi:hypothetical protein
MTHPRSRRHHALTLVELTIGLVVLTIILGAVAGVTLAVSSGWRQSDDAMSEMLAGQRGVTAVAQVLRTAKMVGTVRPGSLAGTGAAGGEPAAAMMIWKGDANGDGRIQLAEVALIEHDPSPADAGGGAIRYYQAPASMPPADAAAEVGPGYLTDPSAPETFKAEPGVAAAATVLAAHVTAAQFAPGADGGGGADPSVRPTFDFALKVQQKARSGDVREKLRYGTAGLRSPGDGTGNNG